jgi:hypothetical protein
MSYDAASGTVIYRSKMHLGLKRNFQVMPGAEWLELLCKHIPDRYEHLVRYVGWYSNRARGERAKALKAQQPATTAPAAEAAVSEFATRTKATWARLIRKVYEADPLVCPKCNGPMRVIALESTIRLSCGASSSTSDARPSPPSAARPWMPPTGRQMRSSPSAITQFPTSHCAIVSRCSGFAPFRPHLDCKRPGAGAGCSGRSARGHVISGKPLSQARRAKRGGIDLPIRRVREL